jgi:hypothetical protein
MIFISRDMAFSDVTVPKGTRTRLATLKEAKEFKDLTTSTSKLLTKQRWKVVFLAGKLRWVQPEDLKAMKKKSMKEVAKTTEVAMRELDLSLITQADKTRWWKIWEGLRDLDDEQARTKNKLDALLEAFEKDGNVPKLTSGLKKIVGQTRTAWEHLSDES